MPSLPQPIEVSWQTRTLSSATTSIERLADHRLQLTIKHAPLKGVTPQMLVWWFENLDGTYRIGDRDHPRYRVWHPRDHVSFEYIKSGTNGSKLSVGARVRIREFFLGNKKFAVDAIEEVVAFDASGFRHQGRLAGKVVSFAEHLFAAVEAGTQYTDRLTIGIEGFTRFNRYLRPWVAPDAMFEAWLQHNVEEMGYLEQFLPRLYRAQRMLTE